MTLVENEYKKVAQRLMKWELNWKELRFERLIGSGSFGDAYKATYSPHLTDSQRLQAISTVDGAQDVAVKRMRAGLMDSKGVANFMK